MKFLSAIIPFILLGITPSIQAQRLPYQMALHVQQIADFVAEQEEITGFLQMTHSSPSDKRPFTVTLITPEKKTPITVAEDGSFALPKISKEIWDKSYLEHNLNKGALTMMVVFGSKFSLPTKTQGKEQEEGVKLDVLCSQMVNGFRKLAPIKAQIKALMPTWVDPKFAITGLTFVRAQPIEGWVYLKKDQETVASIDLSQKGAVTWTFERYDPRLHHLVFNLKEDEDYPRMNWQFGTSNGESPLKNAMPIWHTDQ